MSEPAFSWESVLTDNHVILQNIISKENELLNTYNIALKELGEYKESD